MRLIDADALIDRIKNPYEQAQVARWVNEQPTIEPEKRTEERTETHACDLIDRQAAIDALDVLCQEHRYKIPGKRETYSQYNEAWQDALDRAEGAIFNLPSAQPEIIRCKDCRNNHWCNIQEAAMAGDNFFCGAAERRTDERSNR